MKRLALALALFLAPAVASAQTGIFPPNTVWGNATVSSAQPKATSSLLFPAGIQVGVSTVTGGTSPYILYNNAGILGNIGPATSGYALIGNGATAPSFQGYTAPLTGATTATWQAKAQDVVSLADFLPNHNAALCDGSTDVTTYVRAAFAVTGKVKAPDNGVCRVTGPITLDHPITISGTFPKQWPNSLDKSTYKGSWIFFDFPPSVAQEGFLVTSSGVVIENMGFITQQDVPVNGVWTATVNPWVIHDYRGPFRTDQAANNHYQHLIFFNNSHGIWVDGSSAVIEDVWEGILNTTIRATEIFGHLLVSNWHTENMWPLAVGLTYDKSATVTISIASPGVVSWAGHGLAAGAPITFSNSGGALPTGITAGTFYYVISAGLTANSFEVSLTPGGAAINTSGTQSGTQSASYSFFNAFALYRTANLVTDIGRVDGLKFYNFNMLFGNKGMWFNRGAVLSTSVTNGGTGADATTTASITGCAVAPVVVPVVSGGVVQSLSLMSGGSLCVSPVVTWGGAGTGFAATANLDYLPSSANDFALVNPYFDAVVTGIQSDASGTHGSIFGMTYGYAGLYTPVGSTSYGVNIRSTASFNLFNIAGSFLTGTDYEVRVNDNGVAQQGNYVNVSDSFAQTYDINNIGAAAFIGVGANSYINVVNTIASTGTSPYVPGASSAPVLSGNAMASGTDPSNAGRWIIGFPGLNILAVNSTEVDFSKAIRMFGSSSGSAVLTTQAAAGTPTLLFPTTSGTLVASCTSPLTCSATTGVASLSLTSAHIYVGNGSNLAADVALSGDATISNVGALTLASVITAGGPTGSATVAPIITYDAKGRLTTVSSATITPAIGSITGLGTGIATWLATPSSANLASAMTDKTGTGVLTFATAPTFTTSITVPLHIGGSGTTGTQLTFQTTTGVGTTDRFAWVGGNNGGTTFGTWSATLFKVGDGSTSGIYLNANGLRIGGVDTVNTIYGAANNIGITADSGHTISIGVVTTNVGLHVSTTNGDVTADAQVIVTNLASDATHTDRTVCQDATSKTLFFGSGAAGICLGTSSARFKRDIQPFYSGLDKIVQLEPKTFFYKKGFGDEGARRQFGVLAEDVAKVFPNFVGYDADHRPNTVDWPNFIYVSINAFKELKAANDNLKHRVELLERRKAR